MSFLLRAVGWRCARAYCVLHHHLAGLAAGAAPTDTGATTWMLVASALVLFMTLPGLALFYGGLVRARNLLSVMMQCFVICCVVSLLWAAFGYSLAFGDGGALIGTFDKAFLAHLDDNALRGNLPEAVFVLFQMTFAVITPALIIGAFPERVRFPFVLLFTMSWFVVVYLPVAHWVWGGGWALAVGALDFAGGIVVHTTAGVAALVAAIIVGPRAGFPRHVLPPHSPGMTMAGAGMLWVGWFGFNGGSALAANGSAGLAILATHFAASAACSAPSWSRCSRPVHWMEWTCRCDWARKQWPSPEQRRGRRWAPSRWSGSSEPPSVSGSAPRKNMRGLILLRMASTPTNADIPRQGGHFAL